MASVKVGDVFYESWGYDQTNIDFLEVVEVSPSGKSVVCQMVGKTGVGEDHVIPSQRYGVKFRLLVREGSRSVSLRGSYPFCQSAFPSCRLFSKEDSRSFVCAQGLPEMESYRFWDGGKRRSWCQGCPNYYDEPQISFRNDGGFSRYEKPLYETPLGWGH